MYLRPTGTLMAVGLSTISEMLNIPIALIVGNVRIVSAFELAPAYLNYNRTLESKATLLGNK